MKTKILVASILVILFSIGGFSLATNYINYMSQYSQSPSNITDIYVPPPIDLGIPKTSYKDFINSVPSTSNILLPDKLPRGLIPTNVIGDLNNFIVIDYSSNGYDTIAKSELTLQITSTIGDPYPQNATKGGTFFKIGTWSAFYNPVAPEFEPEYTQLYGNTCRLLNVRIGTTNYQFRAIPDITYDELLQIVTDMKSLH